MLKQKNLRLFYVLIIYIVCAFPPPVLGVDSVNIGVVGTMTDNNGIEAWNGATMAADEINKRGGVRVGQKRMPLKLIKANSNEISNIEYAVNAMEMLFFQNKVDFVVGGFRSEAVMAMQDVAMDHKKIFFSIGAAMPELCQRVAQNYDRYKYYFRGGTLNSYDLGKGAFLQLHHIAQELREKLGQKRIKVAIAAEKTGWVEKMIAACQQTFPKMGLEIVGVFRPSAVATDVSSEIRAIAATGAPLVFTLFSTNMGTAFVTQAADMQLPALMAGINVEAQRLGFWETTDGKANYVMTTSPYCPGVEVNRLTKPFVSNYMNRYGELPTMSSEAYAYIAFILIPSIEQAGTLDSDILVKVIENKKHPIPLGNLTYAKDSLGRPLHDLKFGADYILFLGIQWVDGEMKGIWPNRYVENPGDEPLTLKGVVDLQIPPLVLDAYGAR